MLLQPLNILLSPPLQSILTFAMCTLPSFLKMQLQWALDHLPGPSCRFLKPRPTNLENDSNYGNNNSVNDVQTLCLVRPPGERAAPTSQLLLGSVGSLRPKSFPLEVEERKKSPLFTMQTPDGLQ